MNTQPDEEVRTHLVGDALRARWVVVLLTALVVVAGVGFVVLRGSAQYDASASVFLQPIAGNALSADATANGQQVTVAMETEAGLVDSPGVVRLVSRQLHVSQGDLRSRVSASVPSNTKIVQIQFSADNPRAARAGAQSFAESYLAYRQSLATDAQDRQLAKLRAQVATATASLNRLALSNGSSANARRQILISQLAGLQANIGTLDASDVHPGSVSSVAKLPSKPSGINPALLLAAALLLGLALGGAVAVAREATDDTVRASWTASIAGLPVLSQLRGRHGRARMPVLDAAGGDGELVDAFRRLRVGVLATAPKARTISVCHAVPGKDGVVAVANLGLVMARSGLRVALVDATGGEALTAALGDAVVGDPTTLGGAYVSTAGEHPVVVLSATQEDGGGVDEKRIGRIIVNHKRTADYVLVAATSLITADGEMAALATDTVLLVVEQGSTRRRDLEFLAEHAGLLGVSISGLVSLPAQRRGPVAWPQPVTGRAISGLRRIFSAFRAVRPQDPLTEER